MSREEIQKLLGGYATNTLSPAEQQALFEAALEDQELFDALAKEQALRDVLDEPAARAQLLAALREPVHARTWRWLRWPAALAATGAVALLLIVPRLIERQAELPQIALSTPAPPPPSSLVAPAPPRPEIRPAIRAAPRRQPAPPPPPPQAMMARAVAKLSAPAAPTQGETYGLLRKGADGEFDPVPLDTVFHPGDALRLLLQPDENGSFELYQRDAAGEWRLAARQKVEKGERYTVPASGALQYDEPGSKELRLVFSPALAAAAARPLAEARDAIARAQLAASKTPGQKIVTIKLEYR